MKTKYYYLFGGNAVKQYEESNGFHEFLFWATKADSTDFAICRFDVLNDIPTELLSTMHGWMDFVEIPFHEYLQLKELTTNLKA